MMQRHATSMTSNKATRRLLSWLCAYCVCPMSSCSTCGMQHFRQCLAALTPSSLCAGTAAPAPAPSGSAHPAPLQQQQQGQSSTTWVPMGSYGCTRMHVPFTLIGCTSSEELLMLFVLAISCCTCSSGCSAALESLPGLHCCCGCRCCPSHPRSCRQSV